MRRVRSSNRGYTIVETMIFLGVTGALFFSAMLLVGGQQAKTEFYQGVRDVNSQIQDVLNDVATGYYSKKESFNCFHGASGPTFSTPGTNVQGTNTPCIFVGRVMAFGIHNDPTQLNIFNVMGNRLTGAGVPANDPIVTTLSAAKPKSLLSPETIKLPGGLTVGGMIYNNGVDQRIGAVGIFSKFDQSYKGALAGSQTAQLIPYTGPFAATDWETQTLTGPSPVISEAIDNDTGSITPISTGYVQICFVSAGTDQHALITIGRDYKLATKVEIRETRTCP